MDSYTPADMSKVPPPFSMSGDGVEDIDIPSVLMKNDHALFLLATLKQSGEVVVRLAANDEEKTDKTEEKIQTFTSDFGTFKDNAEGRAEHTIKFLESIKTEGLTEDQKGEVEKLVAKELERFRLRKLNNLKDSVKDVKDNVDKFIAEELQKLKLHDADSADVGNKGESVECVGVSGGDSAPLAADGESSSASVVSQSSSISDGG